MANNDLTVMVHEIERVGNQYGPGLIDTAANVTQINGISCLIWGVIFAATSVVMGLGVRKSLIAADEKRKRYMYDDDAAMLNMAAVILAVLTFFTTILALAQLADVWNYIALVNPKLALAHSLLDKLGSHGS